MGDATALRDLGRILLYFGAFILSALAYYTSKAIAHGVSFLPFGIGGDIAGAIENALIAPLKNIMDGAEADIAKGFSGLVDSLAVWLGLALLLGLGVKAALEYLWHVAIKGFVHGVVDPVAALGREAITKIEAIPGDLERAVGRAERFATSEAERIGRDVRAFATSEIASAEHAAERYADEAVAALRTAENQAIGTVAAIAHEAVTAAHAAEQQAVTTAEAAAAADLAQSEAAGKAALNVVDSIAVTAEHDLETLVGSAGLLGAAGLIAAIPAIATLVRTIAVDTGLENADCRSKVKGICGTDPHAWERLLGLAGFLAIAFDFRDFVKGAELVVEGIGFGLKELEAPFNLEIPPLELAA